MRRNGHQPKSTLHSAAVHDLYEPLDFVMVRTPLKPVEFYRGLSRGSGEKQAERSSLPQDPKVQRALAVGSHELLHELQREPQGRNAGQQAEGKLLRYLIRMSTRPTPYGLFAGVGLGRWGDQTDLALAASEGRTRTRPDMAWLTDFVLALELRPEVRACLCWSANPTVVFRAGRVFLADRMPSSAQTGDAAAGVSLRATGALRRALAMASKPVAYEELASRLLESTPGATRAKVDHLLTELWQHTLLLGDLRPPLTSLNPAQYVADRLASIPPAQDALAQLQSVLAAIDAWDAAPEAQTAEGFERLVAQAEAVTHTATRTPFMVDMGLALNGRQVNHAVGREAARAAEILMRLTSFSDGLPAIIGYRNSFAARYGYEHEVPLVELLDPHFGLGAPAGYGAPAVDQNRNARRSRTLLDLGLAAMRDRRRVVELDPATLEALQVWTPSPEKLPPTLDINIFVAARSRQALDAGDFQVVVGPNLGAMAAGRNLARFADVIGPEAVDALKQAARAEEILGAGQIWAELVYLPRTFRSANVIIRPPIRRYEIALGVTPGINAESVVPLDELVVGLRNGHFYLRWPARDADVVVCSGHMLNTNGAPGIIRFLADVSRDGVAQISSFDWGPAGGLPYLPRVQAGRVVLHEAEWRIDTITRGRDLPVDTSGGFRSALARWRAEWNVPRHVALSWGDNRLVLDLEDPDQCEELRVEVRQLREGGTLILQELLPDLDQTWLQGPDGCFVTELVVSLRRAVDPLSAAGAGAGPAPLYLPAGGAPPLLRPRLTPQHINRLRLPGSEWLFVKLYCPPVLTEEVLAGPVRDFAGGSLAGGLADDWFFIRYNDPDPHIRLRFRGDPDRLTGQLLPGLCRWAAGLVEDERCLRFVIDGYDREVDRYGGPQGADLAERVFGADSRAVLDLLWLSEAREVGIDRQTLALLTVDDLLAGLGLDEDQRAGWYQSHAGLRDQVGDEYRQRKNMMRALLGDPGYLLSQPGGAAVGHILAVRRAALAPLAARLNQLWASGELSQAPANLYLSYIHMHLNRLNGGEGGIEGRALALLLRARESLKHSPVAQAVVLPAASAALAGLSGSLA